MQDRLKFRRAVIVDGVFKGFEYYGLNKGFFGLSPNDTMQNRDTPWEQCTGLKDKNGNLIYEGDVVRMPYNHLYEYADYIVDFMDGAFRTRRCMGMKNKETGEIKDTSKGGYCFYEHFTQSLATACEIIGNIHTATEKDGE